MIKKSVLNPSQLLKTIQLLYTIHFYTLSNFDCGFADVALRHIESKS
jgi:hypothetical protein